MTEMVPGPAETAAQIKELLLESSKYSQKEAEQLAEFSRLVLDKNQYMNLTAIKEAEAFYVKHLEDSLSLLPFMVEEFGDTQSFSMLDIGSGAGFPGIPLKIMRPSMNLVLLDSLQKRMKFLDEVIENLQLKNIKTVHARAEEAGRQKNMRESFDVVSARAVAALPVLIELCAPFVKVGGHFWAMKGVKDELSEAKYAMAELGLELKQEKTFDLPLNQGTRVVLDFVKTKKTGSKYPRKAGMPGKMPLVMV